MQQPELGACLVALRKMRNLTQEELTEKSHVSVRTIQRIEAGEVLPRMSTVKILLAALDERYESFSAKCSPAVETQEHVVWHAHRNTVLIAAVAGIIYLITQIILVAIEIAWFVHQEKLATQINAIYIALTVVMVITFILFARGFTVLSAVFKNKLLKIVSYMLMAATIGSGVQDVLSLYTPDPESMLIHYAITSVIFGALSITFGISLLRLQDGMGELSYIAGLLEIAMGVLLVTVVLFFVSYIVLIPAAVLEILILFRGYEYLSRPVTKTN